jgi:filamentous hemagglutinin family protein
MPLAGGGILSLLPLGLSANPTGGNVVAGSAKITGQGTSAVTINQASHLTIIDWRSFSINSGESTTFLQPGANSAALNRVLGGQTSLINGTLSANGQVYIVNGNGVIIGPGGVVNASAFTASTRDITDADFLSGNLHFTGSSDAGVQNFGTINALGGNIVLIGRTVDNEGTINAPAGTVGLVAGDDVLLAQQNPDGSTITVSPQTMVANAGGKVGVENDGAITAAAAELKAANGNIYGLAVQNRGIIRATTVSHQGGHIWLTSDSGSVSNSGTLDASATAAQGRGGNITLKSATGTVSDTGQIIARGGDGGAGGNAEISGAGVQFSGQVDLTAPGGSKGMLVLDPATIDIVTGGGPILTAATIDPSAIVSALNGANVMLTATTSITVDNEVNASGNASAGNLQFNAPTVNLNAPVLLNGSLIGGANIVNVGPSGLIQNGIDSLLAVGGSVNLTAGTTYDLTTQLVFNKNVVMNGNGAVINGQDSTRLMEVDGGTVSLVGLNLTGGNGVSGTGAAGSLWNYDGGAILVYGLNSSANLLLTNCTVVGNTANSGGGIFSVSILSGTESVQTFSTTFTGNTAINGSALYNYGASGGTATMMLVLSTITGNDGVGAIYNFDSSGTASVSVGSTILAGNPSFSGESDYVNNGASTLTDLGYNLYGQSGNAGGFVPGSLGSTDILLNNSIGTVLGPLGDYGGGLETFPLVAGSPAIDAANPSYEGKTDERGVARGALTQFTGNAPDIGAFEAQVVTVQADSQTVVYGNAPTLTYTITSGPSGDSAAIAGAPELIEPATNVGDYGEDIGQGTITSTPLYILNFTNGDLTITPRPVVVDPDANQSKIYGQPDPVMTYTTAPATATTGLVNGDTLTGSPSYTSAGQFTNVGNYATNLGTLANSNYSVQLSAVAPTFAITPATLTYVADPVNVAPGTPFPVFTGTVTGFVGVDDLASATTGVLVFSTPVTPSAPAGFYPIDGSGLTATSGNYVFAQASSNATALTLGTPVVAPPVPPPSQPDTPVAQAIAQNSAANTTAATTVTTGSLPVSSDTPPAPAPTILADNVDVFAVNPNEFVDATPASSASAAASAAPGDVAQGSSFDPTMNGSSTPVATGQTVTIGSSGAANVPPPPIVQAQLTQILGGSTEDELSSALNLASVGSDQGASAGGAGATDQGQAGTPAAGPAGNSSGPAAAAQGQAASAAAGTSTTSNGPAATGPTTTVAPGQTITISGGKSASLPPPAPVQVAFTQGFSPESRATLASALAASAAASPATPARSGATTVVAPGETVAISGGKSASAPPPAPVQAAFTQGFSPESRATLSQAAGQ